MDISKIFTAICGLLLAVCLTLSITALTVLRTAVKENDATQKKAESLADDLRECVKVLQKEEDETNSLPTVSTPDEETAPSVSFVLRNAGGVIGVYTSDGYLVRLTNVRIDLLPQEDRQRLLNGLPAEDWKEVLTFLQDYEG